MTQTNHNTYHKHIKQTPHNTTQQIQNKTNNTNHVTKIKNNNYIYIYNTQYTPTNKTQTNKHRQQTNQTRQKNKTSNTDTHIYI